MDFAQSSRRRRTKVARTLHAGSAGRRGAVSAAQSLRPPCADWRRETNKARRRARGKGMTDLMSPPAWKSVQSRRAAAKVLSRLPRRAAAAPPHPSSLRRRAVSGSTRREPRVLGHILRDGDPADRGDRGLDRHGAARPRPGEHMGAYARLPRARRRSRKVCGHGADSAQRRTAALVLPRLPHPGEQN